MKTIIIFGKKQSGKDSLAKAIMGFKLVHEGVIPNFSYNEKGECFITYNKETNDGITFTNEDWNNDNIDHYEKYFFPHVRCRNFAANLKESMSKLFSLDLSKLYGTNEEKNEETHISWKDIRPLCATITRNNNKGRSADSKITYREAMEIFGTDICRRVDDPCHVRSTFDFLKNSGTNLAIIADGRFNNEFEFFNKKKNCLRILLKRAPFTSNAISENGLTIPDDQFDFVVDNSEMSLSEKNNKVINFLVEKNYLNKSGIKIDRS